MKVSFPPPRRHRAASLGPRAIPPSGHRLSRTARRSAKPRRGGEEGRLVARRTDDILFAATANIVVLVRSPPPRAPLPAAKAPRPPGYRRPPAQIALVSSKNRLAYARVHLPADFLARPLIFSHVRHPCCSMGMLRPLSRARSIEYPGPRVYIAALLISAREVLFKYPRIERRATRRIKNILEEKNHAISFKCINIILRSM